jgi:hypothetical protein
MSALPIQVGQTATYTASIRLFAPVASAPLVPNRRVVMVWKKGAPVKKEAGSATDIVRQVEFRMSALESGTLQQTRTITYTSQMLLFNPIVWSDLVNFSPNERPTRGMIARMFWRDTILWHSKIKNNLELEYALDFLALQFGDRGLPFGLVLNIALVPAEKLALPPL